MFGLSLLVFVGLATGLAWPGPEPTGRQRGNLLIDHGFTPRPTDGPDVKRVNLALQRRQVSANVCGYESGDQESSITCSLGRTCYFYTKTGVWGMRGCCTGTDFMNCGWALDCVDSTAYSASCDSACQNDPFTWKCTESASPYCWTYRYPGPSVLDYGCGPTAYSMYQTVETTYLGQSLLTYNFRFATLPFTNTDGLPTQTALGLGSTSTSSLEDANERPRGSSGSVRAIVGGVIAGLAFIVGLVVGILLYRRRQRRHRQRQALSAPAPAYTGTEYPPGPRPSGYGPVAQQSSPSTGQAPSQSSYYSPPMADKGNPVHEMGEPLRYQSPQAPVASAEPTALGDSIALPAYHRGSYMPVSNQDPAPPTALYQLHSESASPPPRKPVPSISVQQPPGPAPGPIYEAPTSETRH